MARTALHFGFTALSVAAMALAAAAFRVMRPRWGAWNAALLAIAGYLTLMVLAGLVLPTIDEVPEDFPASLLWQFRVASLGTHLVLWSVVGLVFGPLSERALRTGGRAPAGAGAASR